MQLNLVGLVFAALTICNRRVQVANLLGFEAVKFGPYAGIYQRLVNGISVAPITDLGGEPRSRARYIFGLQKHSTGLWQFVRRRQSKPGLKGQHARAIQGLCLKPNAAACHHPLHAALLHGVDLARGGGVLYIECQREGERGNAGVRMKAKVRTGTLCLDVI